MTTTTAMEPIHPGEILMLDYLEPLGVTQHRVPVAIGVPHDASTRSCTASAASLPTPHYDSPDTSAPANGSG